MTREEAIYRLKALLTMCDFRDAFGDRVDDKLYEDAVAMAIEALQAHPTLDDVSNAYENGYKQGKFEAQQWIPVSDRLPDKDFTDFLVQIGHGEYALYETAYRVRGRWVFYSDRIDGEGQSVIAWMECPSPYTEENNERT